VTSCTFFSSAARFFLAASLLYSCILACSSVPISPCSASSWKSCREITTQVVAPVALIVAARGSSVTRAISPNAKPRPGRATTPVPAIEISTSPVSTCGQRYR